jgi:hypothetical protein
LNGFNVILPVQEKQAAPALIYERRSICGPVSHCQAV